MAPWLALSWMPEPPFALAAAPLLAQGLIDALEWSFDTVWRRPPDPAREALLDHYARAGRLFGHGVGYSLLSVDAPAATPGTGHGELPTSRGASPRADWLAAWRREQARRPYAHLSEHLGFMRAPGFRRGPPLPLPLTDAVVALGREHMARLADASSVPVGLENLAFAFGHRDCRDQGELLERLLAPVDGFLVLDLHNLWCQATNFGLDAQALLQTYPLDRVRELHVSGGSWAETPAGRVRRDTHDGRVPAEVLALLEVALARCPNTRLVVVERLGDTFAAPGADAELRADVLEVRACLDAATARPKQPLYGTARGEHADSALSVGAAPELGDGAYANSAGVAAASGLDEARHAPTHVPQRDGAPTERAALSVAQGALFAALAAGTPPGHKEWASHELRPLAPSLHDAEHRMVLTAAHLLARWGRRSEPVVGPPPKAPPLK